MGGLKRFEDFRYVGARDSMVVYDTEDPEQAKELSRLVERKGLLKQNLLQSFGPDTLAEAANRGFKPLR